MLCLAAEDLAIKKRGLTTTDLNKGYSDKFSFSSQILKNEEKKEVKEIKDKRSRNVEDLNKGSTDNFKMDLKPRVGSATPPGTMLGAHESLSTKGNLKTYDQMSEQYKKK